MSLTSDFSDLFAGRNDCYGGEGGYCVKRKLTDAIWRSHLYGDNPIGIYPLLPASDVYDFTDDLPEHAAVTGWSAVDVDFDDMDFAFHLAELLGDVGIKAYVESSRSKGWHVWIFWSEWCDAMISRSLLLWLVTDQGHPKMEVYPKQFDTSSTALGNYLRLPYPKRYVKTKRQMMYTPQRKTMTLAEFMDGVETNNPKVIEDLSRQSPHWPGNVQQVEVAYRSADYDGERGLIHQEAVQYLDDPERMIPKGERDNMIHTIARLMAGLGWDIEKQRSTMARIVNSQVEGRFPMRVAMEKVERANRDCSRIEMNRYKI